MPVNAGADRPNLWQLDVIVGMKPGLIGRAQLMRAMWTALGKALGNPVQIGGQHPEDSQAAPCASSPRAARRGLACGLARSVPRSCPGFWAAARAWLRE
jgi:hypothetical protein